MRKKDSFQWPKFVVLTLELVMKVNEREIENNKRKYQVSERSFSYFFSCLQAQGYCVIFQNKLVFARIKQSVCNGNAEGQLGTPTGDQRTATTESWSPLFIIAEAGGHFGAPV